MDMTLDVAIEECKRREWDPDIIIGLASRMGEIEERLRAEARAKKLGIHRRSARAEEANRKAEKLVQEYKERHKKVLIPDERPQEDSIVICKDIAKAALKLHKDNVAEVSRLAGINVATLKHMIKGDARVRFDCVIRVARIARVSIAVEGELLG